MRRGGVFLFVFVYLFLGFPGKDSGERNIFEKRFGSHKGCNQGDAQVRIFNVVRTGMR